MRVYDAGATMRMCFLTGVGSKSGSDKQGNSKYR